MENELGTKVSVIIPVYNSEDTIGQCIESVAAQTFGDIEIIVVDDGSNDRSSTICDKMSEGDKRIIVVHQPNFGRSKARENGVKMACGEWITFVDSDDTLPPYAIKDLFEAADEHTDIVFGNGLSLGNEYRTTIPIREFRHLTVKAVGTIGVPWGSLYRHSVVTDRLFELPKDIVCGEDYIFCIRLVFTTEKPVNIVYKSVYCKGKDTTSASFVWTADYSYRLNVFRMSSIPAACRSEYLRDAVEDRLNNLFATALHTPKCEWLNSKFYLDILRDLSDLDMQMPLKSKIYLALPARWLRKFYVRISKAIAQFGR